MLKIRLVRVGKRNKSLFRIAVGDSRRTPKGKFIEKLGYYDPHKKEKSLNKERILYWLSKGAQCSDTVHNLLVSLNVIKGPKRKIKIRPKKEGKEGEAKEVKEKTESKEEAKEKPKEGAKEEEKEKKPEEKKSENKTEEAKKENKEEKLEEKKEETKESKEKE